VRERVRERESEGGKETEGEREREREGGRERDGTRLHAKFTVRRAPARRGARLAAARR
jgi:hypothetical protein